MATSRVTQTFIRLDALVESPPLLAARLRATMSPSPEGATALLLPLVDLEAVTKGPAAYPYHRAATPRGQVFAHWKLQHLLLRL